MVYQIKNKADLDSQIAEAGDKLVVIDFFATWCGPCKRIAPFLEKLAQEHEDKLLVVKVDCDENEELNTEYNINVMPTFIFKRNGRNIDCLTGASESSLREHIEKHLSSV